MGDGRSATCCIKVTGCGAQPLVKGDGSQETFVICKSSYSVFSCKMTFSHPAIIILNMLNADDMASTKNCVISALCLPKMLLEM